MSASPYSIVMAMIWFTLASMIGHFILRRAEKCGLAFIGMIFLLTTIRIFAPLDIAGSIIIRSQVIYPTVQNWMRYPIAGSVTVGGCLILLWIAGAAFQFVGLLLDWKRQRKFRNKAMLQEGNGRLDMLFQKVADEFGHHGPFCLAVGENVTSVYQAGFLHPYILLPAQIELFSDEDICNMFRHELCHFLSRDLWIKAGFQVIGCVLWWNPVMPLLKRSVEQLLELRCDRKVCRQLSEEKQLSYMTTLSALVKHGSASVAQVYMGYLGQDNDTDMMQRFRMLLLGKPKTVERCRQIISCALCLVLFIASYCVILQPWGEPDASSFESVGTTNVGSELGYILCKSDGTLELYCEDEFVCTLTDATLNTEPFNEMLIIYEGSSNSR